MVSYSTGALYVSYNASASLHARIPSVPFISESEHVAHDAV